MNICEYIFIYVGKNTYIMYQYIFIIYIYILYMFIFK